MTGDAWLRIMNAVYPGHSCHVCDGTGWVVDPDGDGVLIGPGWQAATECPHCRRYGADRQWATGLSLRNRIDRNRSRRTR